MLCFEHHLKNGNTKVREISLNPNLTRAAYSLRVYTTDNTKPEWKYKDKIEALDFIHQTKGEFNQILQNII